MKEFLVCFGCLSFFILNTWAVCLGGDSDAQKEYSNVRFVRFLRKLPGYYIGKWLFEDIRK